jgi:hypothetical protein
MFSQTNAALIPGQATEKFARELPGAFLRECAIGWLRIFALTAII